MKKLITLLSLSIGIISFSQVELHRGGEALGSSITIDSATSSIDHFDVGGTYLNRIYIVNSGSTDETITHQRIRRYHKAGWTETLCDPVNCVIPENTDIWNNPLNPQIIIAVGDSGEFRPRVYPNGIDGCSIYTYIIKSGDDELFADSVQITYSIGGIDCFLGTDEIETALNYSVYPNPANDVLNISIAENNTSITLFDVIGKTVSEMELINGNNSLNIENLNPGVYFYSIKRNGAVIETEKLIIK